MVNILNSWLYRSAGVKDFSIGQHLLRKYSKVKHGILSYLQMSTNRKKANRGAK